MREFKFRRWSKVQQRLYGVSTPSEGDMQYTGLKDRHGVDIYEGDIFGKREEFRAVVKQEEDGRWVVVFVDKRIPKMSITDRLIRESEIIGNIYENGELLK